MGFGILFDGVEEMYVWELVLEVFNIVLGYIFKGSVVVLCFEVFGLVDGVLVVVLEYVIWLCVDLCFEWL